MATRRPGGRAVGYFDRSSMWTFTTRAPRNELRNAADTGVQLSTGLFPTRMQSTRSQAGRAM